MCIPGAAVDISCSRVQKGAGCTVPTEVITECFGEKVPFTPINLIQCFPPVTFIKLHRWPGSGNSVRFCQAAEGG